MYKTTKMQEEKKMLRTTVAICIAGMILISTGMSHASVVYSTLPADNSFDTAASYGMAGSASEWGEIDLAAVFTVPNIQNLYLDSIDVAMRTYFSSYALIDVMVTTGNAGNPGTVLATTQVTAPANAAVVTADFANTLSLTAGGTYWVRLSVANTTGQALWSYSKPAVSGNCKFSNDNGVTWHGYSTLPAFRVNAIPEPATLVMLGFGALMCGRRKAKKQQ
jgi:hypothetical protein